MPKKANLTVAEIKSALTKEGISYPAWAKRPALVKIYAQNFIQAGSKTRGSRRKSTTGSHTDSHNVNTDNSSIETESEVRKTRSKYPNVTDSSNANDIPLHILDLPQIANRKRKLKRRPVESTDEEFSDYSDSEDNGQYFNDKKKPATSHATQSHSQTRSRCTASGSDRHRSFTYPTKLNDSRDIPSDPKDQLTLNLLATLKNSIDRLNRHVGLSPEKTVQFDSQCQQHQQTDVDQLAETRSAHDQPYMPQEDRRRDRTTARTSHQPMGGDDTSAMPMTSPEFTRLPSHSQTSHTSQSQHFQPRNENTAAPGQYDLASAYSSLHAPQSAYTQQFQHQDDTAWSQQTPFTHGHGHTQSAGPSTSSYRSDSQHSAAVPRHSTAGGSNGGHNMSHRLNMPMAMGMHGVAPDAISHVDIVSTRLKQDIIRGKDVNLAALLSGYNPEIDHCNRHLVIGENVVPLKPLPDTRLSRNLKLDEFILAFSVYRNIMCDTFPQRRSELDAYCNEIILMATKFRGTGFYDYHKAFSAKAAALLLNQNIKLDWSLKDNGLFSYIFAGQRVTTCSSCSSLDHSTESCSQTQNQIKPRNSYKGQSNNYHSSSSKNSTSTNLDRRGRRRIMHGGQEICNNFNSPNSCTRDNCQFLHICQKCKDSHPYGKNCRQLPATKKKCDKTVKFCQ